MSKVVTAYRVRFDIKLDVPLEDIRTDDQRIETIRKTIEESGATNVIVTCYGETVRE